MRKLILSLISLLLAIPLSASEPVTVKQLEQIVNELHDRPDKDASQRLAGYKLTERLSTVRLDRLQDSLPGERSRMALLAIADASEFSDLPSSDLDASPVPNQAIQKQILSRAVDFVITSTAKMPDFLAQKKILRFQDTKFGTYENEPVIVTPDLYHLIDSRVEAVRYRNGQEEGANGSSKHERHEAAAIGSMMGLTTHGSFGPLLQTVMRDILSSRIGWSHWEKSPSGPVAVFRYSVPKDQATFTVSWCCAAEGPGASIYRDIELAPKYHGEISVNPETGAFARLVLIADIDAGQPVSAANVYLEYGPVEIGDRTYLCPTKSATLLIAKSPIEHGKYTRGGTTMWHESVEDLSITSVSDTRFEQYHVFRSDMKILE